LGIGFLFDQFFFRYTSKGEDMEVNANLNTLTIEAKSGITVMEPFNADMLYSKVAGKQNICAKMTEICTHFSFSILHLILRLQDDVMSFMRITSEEMTVECSEFDKIWVSTSESSSPKIYLSMCVCVFADGFCKQAVEFF